MTADFAPGVGNLTPRFVKSPVFGGGGGGGVGHEIDKCIIRGLEAPFTLGTLRHRVADTSNLTTYLEILPRAVRRYLRSFDKHENPHV